MEFSRVIDYVLAIFALIALVFCIYNANLIGDAEYTFARDLRIRNTIVGISVFFVLSIGYLYNQSKEY